MLVPETEIVVTQDGAEILRKTVRPGDYVIGRDGGCDVPVKSDTVSERHAQITINYDHAFIEDLGSESGTFVNGQRVSEPTRLWPSQKIQVGAATITLRRKRAPTDPAQSLAPQTEVVRRLLPEEILREQKYDIGGQIAQGGMGAILSAKEIAIRREVAMKVMLGSGGQEDLLRFVEEAQITGQLEHPNIVPVHELSVDENDQVFYTMKLVRGVTLRQVLEELSKGDAEAIRKFPLSALLTVFQKVCDAVAFAHSKGVIHRDLKPDNIMLGDFGEVLVMDWGLAKQIGDFRLPIADCPPRDARTATQSEIGNRQSAMTQQGSIMGTPQYMAPEQARGEIDALDARSDIFALGAILYHLLTLHPPVEGANLDEILVKVRAGQFVPPIQRVWQAKPCPSAPLPKPLPKPDRPLPHAIDSDAPTLVHNEGADDPGNAASVGRRSSPPPATGGQDGRPTKHLPGGSVPESLNAVVMKAMALEQAARYQSVAELQADLTAFQTGFATRAENASLMKQIILLVKRHKGVFATAAAAWFVITALAVWFVINIRASEHKATHNAEIAAENEKRAEANEKKATESAKLAAERAENTRRALAKSQIALAEAAYRSGNGREITAALKNVPEDLRDADWSYLSARADTSIARVLEGMDLRDVAAHPKEPGVYAVSEERGMVMILRARTGEKLLEFHPEFSPEHDPKRTVLRLAFSPDGASLAIGHDGKGILICDARDGKKLKELDAVNSAKVSFSPDGKLLLQQYYDQRNKGVALFDASTGDRLWSHWIPEEKFFRGAAFTSDGKQVIGFAVRQGRDRIVVLNAEDGVEVRELTPNPLFSFPETIAAPVGDVIVASDAEGEVAGFALKDGHALFRSRVYDQPIYHLALATDGNRFVSIATLRDGRQSIQLSRLKDGRPLESLLGGGGTVNSISVHPLSGELLVAGPDSRLWNLALAPEIATAKSSRAAYFWGSDDVMFVAYKAPSQADLWDFREAKTLWEPEGPTDDSRTYPDHVSISRDGRYAAVNGDPLQVLKWTDGKPEVVASALSAPSWNSLLQLSPDGARVVLSTPGHEHGEVRDTFTGNRLCKLKAPPFCRFRALGWAGDGTRIVGLATVNQDRGTPGSEERIVLWDAATGEEMRSVVNPTAMDVLAVAPDGRSFAEAGTDRRVRIRDSATLAVLREFRVHDDRVTALAWHPGKPILATGSADNTVKLWNIETGRSLEEFRGLLSYPVALSISLGGTRLACAIAQGAARVWEPQSLNAGSADRAGK